VDHFYGHIPSFQQPCALWSFDTQILAPPNPNPNNIPTPTLRQINSDRGDVCHYTIHHIGNTTAQRIFDKQQANGLKLCCANCCEAFTVARAVELKNIIVARFRVE